MWDATCSDNNAASFIIASSALPRSATTAAEDLRRRKQESLASGYHTVPLTEQTSGVIGPAAIALIKEVGRRIAVREDDSFF